jgi:hypothetical protein
MSPKESKFLFHHIETAALKQNAFYSKTSYTLLQKAFCSVRHYWVGHVVAQLFEALRYQP